MFQKALSLHQKGRLAEAASLYREILRQNPKNADALHLLGVIEAQSNNPLAAMELFGRAVELSPNNATLLSNRGLALQALRRFDEAIASYDRALAIKPDHAEAFNNRGLALHELKRFDDALASYDCALAIKPDHAEALYNRGRALQEMERFADAIAAYDRALVVKPDYAQALYNRGLALQELKNFAGALASYARVLSIGPDHADALNNRGLVLHELKRFDEALASYDRALTVRPGHAETLYNRGRVLQELERFTDALVSYERALAIKPDYADALNNCGIALQDLNRAGDGLASFERALIVNPNYAEALNNRGLALQELKRLDEAIASFDRALKVQPDYADAHNNRGMAKLLGGDLPGGWTDYAWRWKTKGFAARPAVEAREWQGEDLNGRSILVFAEQGRGDVIQFARYLPLLARRGASVTFLGPAEISRLFGSLDAQITFIGVLNPGDTFDFQCALMSLPLRFRTDMLSIPNDAPYLRAERDLIARWKAPLGDHGFKIGIAWQGNPQRKTDRGRSVPLAQFVPLSRLAGVRLISLQKRDGLDQLARLPEDTGIEILGEGFDNGPDAFVDTAAIMENLDLVISSDTAIAHLAGALGRPIWVALKSVPDWRWMLERNDSPWYPTMRLFRQEAAGDWQVPFAAIEQALRSVLREPQDCLA